MNNFDFTDYICETCCDNCWKCELSSRFTDLNYVYDFLDEDMLILGDTFLDYNNSMPKLHREG